jgi:hypothetical protein
MNPFLRQQRVNNGFLKKLAPESIESMKTPSLPIPLEGGAAPREAATELTASGDALPKSVDWRNRFNTP